MKGCEFKEPENSAHLSVSRKEGRYFLFFYSASAEGMLTSKSCLPCKCDERDSIAGEPSRDSTADLLAMCIPSGCSKIFAGLFSRGGRHLQSQLTLASAVAAGSTPWSVVLWGKPRVLVHIACICLLPLVSCPMTFGALVPFGIFWVGI